ncbi:MAG: hypothetical protein HXX12_16575 [Geothrix sp.]|uniref:DUF5700 domain-containing putative Zn-dependent protease n=1 Tax=Geothrix sp. TaxID=1962974 RepID=UPI001832EEC8|nr:DUF5700 domain-containing putative Zn-dependent protease [Geothrix sp.]NWJ42579.1 hypothetical protein [Geothrix sp.]WIL19461.1 MAG: hypothetical protein QOZ81_001978 [Geothrix sp.]
MDPRAIVTSLLVALASHTPGCAQGLAVDAGFAEEALRLLEGPAGPASPRLLASPALAHLLRHARHWDYDVPKASPEALASHLLKKVGSQPDGVATLRASLTHFRQVLQADDGWTRDALDCLPAGFRFQGSALYLTCGYDIGVATPGCASLNGAHPHFKGHPRELTYYAIHELHHVGYMAHHPPLRLEDLKTCGDLLRFVEYSTHMEGMAVWAAHGRRERDGALAEDADYVALGDAATLARLARAFRAIHDDLSARKRQVLTPGDWALLDQLAGKERLWYRVGAMMARDIERSRGRGALASLVREGPAEFFKAHRALAERP